MPEVLTKSLIEQHDSEVEEAFSVVIAYEDTAARDRAILLCDHLVEKLWEDFEFEASWLRFDYLADSRIATDAIAAVARADMVIFSAHDGRELPRAVKAWVETWAARKGNRHRILVSAIGVAGDSMNGVSPMHSYLRDIAQKAGMDYLSNVTEVPPRGVIGSVEGVVERTERKVAAAAGVFKQGNPPSRWGINE